MKSPKIFLRDSGLLHTLLGIPSYDTLLGHPSAGVFFEGWVIEQVIATLPSHWTTSFYRTSAGAEIDLVLQPSQKTAPIAVEIKHALAPKPTKGFWTALDDIQPERAYVIYPGQESYPLAERVIALPMSEIGGIVEA